jgi:diguanylate cyclase (GGDEF)-like protein
VLESLPQEANVILIAHPEHKLLGTRYRLLRGATLEIGRSNSSDVSLADVPSVSRHHARLRFGDLVTLEDLGSTNGTLVNDRVIKAASSLRSGDRFQVGAVHFKFLHEHDVEHAYHAAVYEMMMRDGLTQLYNRRKFQEEAERECARVKRYSRPLSLVLFDVDHFKKVNDTYGHLRGDAVLQRVAASAREMTRTEQILARIGGEEFAILCPEVESRGATVLSERLRENIARQSHSDRDREFGVTCSFGVAGWQAWMDTFTDLYLAADDALYRSKGSGRNRVTTAEPRQPETRPASQGA